jgi:hypothetical protein
MIVLLFKRHESVKLCFRIVGEVLYKCVGTIGGATESPKRLLTSLRHVLGLLGWLDLKPQGI